MVRTFAEKLSIRHKVAVDYALHEPNAKGDNRNYHAHLLMSTRRLTADGFTEKTRGIRRAEKRRGRVLAGRMGEPCKPLSSRTQPTRKNQSSKPCRAGNRPRTDTAQRCSGDRHRTEEPNGNTGKSGAELYGKIPGTA